MWRIWKATGARSYGRAFNSASLSSPHQTSMSSQARSKACRIARWTASIWLSSPSLVAARLADWLRGSLYVHLAVTMEEIAVGVVLGTTLGAVVRGEDVIIAHHDTTVQPDDHLILFLTDRRHMDAVEKLFQGSASFL